MPFICDYDGIAFFMTKSAKYRQAFMEVCPLGGFAPVCANLGSLNVPLGQRAKKSGKRAHLGKKNSRSGAFGQKGISRGLGEAGDLGKAGRLGTFLGGV